MFANLPERQACVYAHYNTDTLSSISHRIRIANGAFLTREVLLQYVRQLHQR